MPRIHIPTILRDFVIERARCCCEYCLMHQDDAESSHWIDHLIAIKHGGKTEPDNLAWACQICNRNKGTDFAAFDPLTGQPVMLFNPRTQQWSEHFELQAERIIGLTPAGRATVELLKMNTEARLMDRRLLIKAKRYPPK